MVSRAERPLISVIIPSLNEELYLEATLHSVACQETSHEIVVVDGGSRDRTRQIAAPYATVVEAPRGRARQMNEGACMARGDLLFFLHADSHLPPHALDLVRRSLATHEAGTFRLRFDTSTPLLRFYSFCTRLDNPWICFGDRGLFVTRAVFDEEGGFLDQPMFEDLELVRRLHRRGRFAFLDASVTTSARRFVARGAFRQQLRNSYLWLHYLAGTDPCRLAHLYPYSE